MRGKFSWSKVVVKKVQAQVSGQLFWPLLGALLCLAPASVRADYTATVSPGSVVSVNFQGWGSSLCWWANVTGGYPDRTNFVDLAYNQLKLNIARYNIGGGENPAHNFLSYRAAMPGFEPANGVWNWNADSNQRWVLQYALAHGVNLVDAFANSPPYWMTVSGSVTGAVGATNNLLVADQTLFANYLATVVSNLTVLDGVHFDYVTPMNEPVGSKWTYGNTQEGCDMGSGQQAPVINDLWTALSTSLPSAGIDASEDTDPYQTVSDLNAYSSPTLNNVALCTTHTYSVTGAASLASKASSLGKPLWVAEYGDGDGTGLTMAQHIHDDITVMGVRAWNYWQVVDSASGWGFLYNPLVAVTNASYTTNYTINEKFYAMGQFSEFIRPGCNIISVNDASTLAAWNPTNASLVLVTVNTNTSSYNVTYNLSAFGSLSWHASVYQTASGKNLAALAAPVVAGQTLTEAIPAQSVTTFVLTTNLTAPTIASQSPASNANSIQLSPGEAAAFSISVAGSTPLYYQWLSNSIAILGATNASYTSPNNLALNSLTLFDCLVSNTEGSATSLVWSVSIIPAPAAFYSQAVLALAPAGYWPMHEVEAPVAGDVETNYGTLGLLGTGYYPDYQVNVGAMIRPLPGPLANGSDQAVYFTGPSNAGSATNGVLVARTSPLAALKPPFTVECWLMATNIGTGQGDLWSQGDGSKATGIRVYYQNSVNDQVSVLTYPSGQISFANFTTNQWHHLVVSCSATTNFTTWFDGVSGPTLAAAGKYVYDTHTPFTLGTGLGFQRAFHGIESEVAVYTNVLSDVTTHYNDAVNASASASQYFYDVTNDNPVIYLRMSNSGYTVPAGPWPTLVNYGQTNGVAVYGGVYAPGTLPGAVNGTAYNNFPPGLLGTNAAQLSGVSSFADAGYAPAFNPAGAAPFTVSAIFRGNPTDTNRVQSIAGHGTNSWELGLTAAGLLVFNSGTNSTAVVATGSGAGDLVSTTIACDDGNWHQVVAVHAGTTNLLCVDGQPNNTNVLVAASNVGNSYHVMIGSDPCYTNNPVGLGRQFAGQVCEVAFFTNALTLAQVQTIYNAGVSLPSAGLTITNRGGSQMELNWNYGTLQSATNSVGPYADMTNIVQPYAIPATNLQQFYRVREN